MTFPDDILEEAANRLVDDQEYMIIDPPDEVEPEPEDSEED